jgi:hypothetical protein
MSDGMSRYAMFVSSLANIVVLLGLWAISNNEATKDLASPTASIEPSLGRKARVDDLSL